MNHPRVKSIGYINDIYSQYKKYEFTIIFSRYREGMPRVAIESLMMNVPLIYNNFVGSNDLEKIGKIGINLEKKDKISINNFKSNVRSIYLNNLDSNTIFNQIIEIYK